MKKNIPTPLAILIISLVVAIIGMVFLLYPAEEKFLPQKEAGETELDIVSTTTRTETDYGQSISTENWQTYRNEEYEFEIKYPQVWYLEERKGINVSPPYINIMEVVLNEKKIDKKEQSFVSVNIQDPDYVSGPKDWKDFELGQINGEISCSTGMGCEIVIWSNNYQDFHIITTNNPSDDKLTSQILSTFRFIEPVETCVDNCGNGICEEIVCLAIGCPCAETKESCPEDCGTMAEPESLQLEIKDFTTDKETYTSNEELRASLTVLSSGKVDDVLIKLTGIKPYSYAYINNSQTVDLVSGKNEINFTATTPRCTSGCGGVYPGPYDLNVEIFVEENLITSSTIPITLTNN